MDVVELGCVTKKLSGNVLEGTVVSGVDAAAGSLDEVTQDVETVGFVQRQEGVLGGDDVSAVDGIEDSRL